jgi:hypothetical protein
MATESIIPGQRPDPESMYILALEISRKHPGAEADELLRFLRDFRDRFRALVWPPPPEIGGHITRMDDALNDLLVKIDVASVQEQRSAAVAVSTSFQQIKNAWIKTDTLLRQMMERVVSLEKKVEGLIADKQDVTSALNELMADKKERDRAVELAQVCYVFEEWVRSRVDGGEASEELEDHDDEGVDETGYPTLAKYLRRERLNKLTAKQRSALEELQIELNGAKLTMKDVTWILTQLKSDRIMFAHPDLAGKDLIGHAKRLPQKLGGKVELLIKFMALRGIVNVSVP